MLHLPFFLLFIVIIFIQRNFTPYSIPWHIHFIPTVLNLFRIEIRGPLTNFTSRSQTTTENFAMKNCQNWSLACLYPCKIEKQPPLVRGPQVENRCFIWILSTPLCYPSMLAASFQHLYQRLGFIIIPLRLLLLPPAPPLLSPLPLPPPDRLQDSDNLSH